MSRHTIDLVIRTVSPLHITEPGSGRYDPETGNLTYGDKGLPCARVKQIPIARPSLSAAAGERAPTLPVIPGNTFRGALRRFAAKRIFDKLLAKGDRMKMDLYHVMLCGAASASPGDGASISETVEGAKNPFAGLFGGGPSFVWSSWSAGNGFVVNADTVAAEMVPESYAQQGSNASRYTAFTVFPRVDDIMRGGSGLPAVLDDPEKEISQWIALLEGARAQKKQEQADEKEGKATTQSKKVSLQAIQAKEYVIPGTTFHSRHFVETELASAAALGIYLHALCDFANAQRLGGGARDGCGRFSMVANFISADGGMSPCLTRTDGKYTLNVTLPVVADAVAAYDSFIATVSTEQLRKAFRL